MIGRRLLVAAMVTSGGVRLAAQAPVRVASKPFGESYLLCEMFAQLLESRGIAVTRQPGLGATEVAFGALRTDAIDVYPEYTGTGLLAVLHDTLTGSDAADPRAVYAHVARASAERWGVRWLAPLGFENTYAIAVTRDVAARFRLASLSDLAREAPRLSAGLTADFIGRADGLPALARTYGMKFKDVRPLAPAVKYQALAAGSVDVIDGYSTDGLLARYDLVVLTDDRHVFPPYEASAVVAPGIVQRRPEVISILSLLSGRLDAATMRQLNKRLEVDGEDVAVVAASALAGLGLAAPTASDTTRAGARRDGFFAYVMEHRASLFAQLIRHLWLVGIALAAAIAVAVPLGLALERSRAAAEPVIRFLGVIQTIPSIALLAFMSPLLGVGVLPALVALWLYSLYPIIRTTFSGVRDADPAAIEAAEALGTTARQRLLWVRLPLAAPVIMAGIRTAAVIAVGAATLAAFIGAGGLGDPIVQGLSLADSRMVLSGALPAALLALVVDGVLAAVERVVTPAHRRVTRQARGDTSR
jgi:osmoprotectant transport system permease protein